MHLSSVSHQLNMYGRMIFLCIVDDTIDGGILHHLGWYKTNIWAIPRGADFFSINSVRRMFLVVSPFRFSFKKVRFLFLSAWIEPPAPRIPVTHQDDD